MSQNLFQGGPQVDETLKDSFEGNNEPLTDLSGKELEADGAGIYGEFKAPGEDVSHDSSILTEVAVFNAEENSEASSSSLTDLQESNEENQVNKNFEENKYYPLIKSLLADKKGETTELEGGESELSTIEQNTFNEISNNITSKNQKIDKEFVDGLNIKKEDKNLLISYLEKFTSVENVNENIKNFGKDIKGVDAFESIYENQKSQKKDTLDFDLFEIIGKNYVNIEKGNGQNDKEKDLKLAVQTTANEFLSKYANIPKDTETFKNSLKNIKSKNLDENIEGLKTLYALATIGSAFGVKMEKVKLQLTKFTKDKKEKLILDYQEILEQLKNDNLGKDKKNDLEEQKQSIEDQAKEIDSGIFEVGELDIGEEKAPEGKDTI